MREAGENISRSIQIAREILESRDILPQVPLGVEVSAHRVLPAKALGRWNTYILYRVIMPMTA